jgi:integrase/recombinase XerD
MLPKSVKRKVATLKSLFRYLEREEIVGINPFHNMDIRIREPRRLPRTVPLSTLKRLFKSLYHIKENIVSERAELRRLLVRDIAVLELLFATAPRISEICNLKTDDVDLRRGRVRISGKGGRERLIHVSDPEVLSALNEYCSTKHELPTGDCFFQNRNGKRLSDHAVRMLLRKHTKAAGIALHLTPHSGNLPSRGRRRYPLHSAPIGPHVYLYDATLHACLRQAAPARAQNSPPAAAIPNHSLVGD